MLGGKGNRERVQYLPPQFDPAAIQVSRNVDPKKAPARPATAAQHFVTFIALSYLGIFPIKLLTKAPEVGKAVANPDCVCV